MKVPKTVEIIPNKQYGTIETIPIEKTADVKKVPSFWGSGQVKEALSSGVFSKKVESKQSQQPSKDEVEMEKLIFNCDENIYTAENSRLMTDLENFSCRDRSCDSRRSYYHRIFWIILILALILVIIRVMYIYALRHPPK